MKRANDQPSPTPIPIPSGLQEVFVSPGRTGHASSQPAAGTGQSISGSSAGNQPGMTSTTARTGSVFLPLLPSSVDLPTPDARIPRAHFTYPQYAYLAQPLYHALLPMYPLQLASGAPVNNLQAYRSKASMPGVAPQQPAMVPGEREARESGINFTKLDDAKVLLAKVKKNIRHGYTTWKMTFYGLVEPEKTAFATHTFFELVRNRHFNGKHSCEHLYDTSWKGAVYEIMKHVGMEKLIAMEWPDRRSFVQVLIDIELEGALGKALRFRAAARSLHSVDKNGCTPLHNAVRRGLLQAVISILAHDDASGRLRMRRDNKKQIPLHMTGKKTTEALIRALLDRKGKEQRMTVSNGGSLPIHQAVEAAACRDIIEILLEECAAEQCLAQRAEDKCTALMLAIRSSSVYAVTALLAVNNTAAEQLGARDANGHTPIVYAQVICNRNVLSLIDAATNCLPASPSSSANTAPTQAITQVCNGGASLSLPLLVAVKVEGGDAIIEEQVEEEYSWEEDHV